MEWQFVVALVVALPVILFPAALVWYLQIASIYEAIQQARTRGAERGGQAGAAAKKHAV